MKTALVILCLLSLTGAELTLKGQFRISEDDSRSSSATVLPLDPASRSAIIRHEGDMAFMVTPGKDSHHQLQRTRRNAVYSTRYLWRTRVVPYEISPVFSESERRVIFTGMKHWEDNVCVRFRPRRNSDRTSIYIMSAPPYDCYSFVGHLYYLNEPQGVALGPGCVTLSTVTHELGHVLGFYHEHNRPDRDDYINIRNNVGSSLGSQLQRLRFSNTLGLGYDYASIMHYSSLGGTITAKNNVPFGNAEELSPLDIEKARRLYQCSNLENWPPASTIVPPEPELALPPGSVCGDVIKTNRNGFIQFPGSPSHPINGNCTYVLEVPKGYGLTFRFSNLFHDSRFDCPSRYVQLHYGSTLSGTYAARFGRRYPQGRLCRATSSVFSLDATTITINYHTDSSSPRAVRVDYTVRDINECVSSLCHRCTNLPGTFKCDCRPGYYHSPAANTCYDVNECAYNNGGCSSRCVNLAGSYTCDCENGFLQADGVSCGNSRPAVTPLPQTPGTINPISRLTTSPAQPPTTTHPPTIPTTMVSTPSSNCPQPKPASNSCGGTLTQSEGSFSSPFWPNTAYPLNIECEWVIQCPGRDKLVNIFFEESFRVAGQQPDCTKDRVEVIDCAKGSQYGPYCHLTRPDPLRGLGNHARVRFISKQQRGGTRTGFGARYTCIDGPMTATTSLPPPISTTPTTDSSPVTSVTTADSTEQPQSTATTPTMNSSTMPAVSTALPTNSSPTATPTVDDPTITTPTNPTTGSTSSPPATPVTPETSTSSCPLLEIPDLSTFVSSRLTCSGVVRRNRTVFGPSLPTANLPSETSMRCVYYGIGTPGRRYQLKFLYMDFPKDSSCEDVKLVIHSGLSTTSPVRETVCSRESCGKFAVLLPGHTFLAEFVVSDKVMQPFKGFMAVFEERSEQ